MKFYNVSRKSITTTSFVGAVLLLATPVSAFYDAENSEELSVKYPLLETDRSGNPNILCPFLRMVERSGRLDGELIAATAEEQPQPQQYRINNDDLKEATADFGCDTYTGCGPVIDLVSSGQRNYKEDEGTSSTAFVTFQTVLSVLNPFKTETPFVDLERLWAAPPVSHDCGFTFENRNKREQLEEDSSSSVNRSNQPGRVVSDFRIQTTMAKFSSRKDTDGRLTWGDVLHVKEQICLDEGVEMSGPGETEAKLIFAFLGGVDRGFVDYDDVERFLQVNNQLPTTKAEKQITAFYLGEVG